MVGADRADEIDLPRAAHTGDLRSEGLGELDGVGADTSRRADDQDLLPRLDAAGIAETLDGRAPGDRDDGGVLEAEMATERHVRSRAPRGAILRGQL
jgi:hypothetical protein